MYTQLRSLYALANSNLGAGLVSASLGAYFSYRLSIIYREEELSDLQDKNKEFIANNRELRAAIEALKTTNTQLSSELAISSRRESLARNDYRDCVSTLRNSYCLFGRPSLATEERFVSVSSATPS